MSERMRCTELGDRRMRCGWTGVGALPEKHNWLARLIQTINTTGARVQNLEEAEGTFVHLTGNMICEKRKKKKWSRFKRRNVARMKQT